MAHSSQSDPNHPHPNSEHSSDDDPYAFFTSDHIDGLRQAQLDILVVEERAAGSNDTAEIEAAQARAFARFDEMRRNYLAQFGIGEDDKLYDDCLYALSLVSWDKMNEAEWIFGKYENGQWGPSGRLEADQFHDYKLDEYRSQQTVNSAPYTNVPNQHVPDDNPAEELFKPTDLAEILRLDDDVIEKRDKLAAMALKRQGQIFNDKMQDEFDVIHKEYTQAVVEKGKFIEAQKRGDRTDDEKNESVMSYLEDESAQLRDITNEKWADTRTGKFCKILASGNFAQRVAKGVAIGVVIGGAVAAATAITGGAAAAVTAGGAIGGAGRFLRTYGAIRGRKAGMAGELTDKNRQELAGYIGSNGIEAGVGHLADLYEKAIATERLKNRRAVIWGIGSLATGSYAGVALEHAFHLGGRTAGWVESGWERVHSFFGGHGNHVPHHSLEGQASGPGVGNTTPMPIAPYDVAPRTGGPNILDHLVQDHFTIRPGEGGYEFVKQFGGTAADWRAIQDHLLAAHPHDFYRMGDGNVGFAHPGRLSDGSIIDIAQRLGVWHT